MSTGPGSVPKAALNAAQSWVEARNCVSGRLDVVTTQASTTLESALRLQPANKALESFAQALEADTPIYDVTFAGNCVANEEVAGSRKMIAQMEVLFFMSNNDVATITNSRGTWEGITPKTTDPFGPQFESCESDLGCGGG